jgi:hypothetical protein
MGPLISAAAPRDGRELRRRRAASPSAASAPDGPGFWFPHVLVEATNDDRVAREEVFGPVAALIPFDDEADAIRIANDTPYGLSGSIWTRDGARALRVARALETGVLSRSTRTAPCASRRRSAASSSPASAASSGCTRSTATRKSRTSSTRRRADDKHGTSRRQGLRDHRRRRRHGPRRRDPVQRGRRERLRRRRQPRRGRGDRARPATPSRSRSTSPTKRASRR